MMALLSAAMAAINAGGAYMFAAWSVSSLVASHLVDKVSWLAACNDTYSRLLQHDCGAILKGLHA